MNWQILGRIGSKKPKERRGEIINFLFANRDLKTEKQKEVFLNPKKPDELTYRDVGISSVQLAKAAARIKKAVGKKEKIVVYGDYDTDGVCATAIIWEALHRFTDRVMPFIPTREEGHGLKVDRIDRLAKDGVKLIITVDQGIVHSRQVAHAKKIGTEIIITDHHLPGKKIPKAAAIVHTTRLAGCGVAWFLARELRKRFRGVRSHTSEVARQRPRLLRGENGEQGGLDLAVIGTVTDMVPLIGPNRSIVKYGLEEVRKTKRPGLLSLYESAVIDKNNIGAYEVGFIIGPRLNASGRMQDPMDALRLVCTYDKNRAKDLAQMIDRQNRERQALTRQTSLHARELWLKQDAQRNLIFIHHQSYEQGVVGLVAGKLKDEFYRPAVVLAPRRDHWVASARSIEEFNIIKAIRMCADILGDHGGHKLAAGFSVMPEKIQELKERLLDLADEQIDPDKLTPTLVIDVLADLTDLNFELFGEIERFAPFGQGNSQPIFATPGVEVADVRAVGQDRKHLKLRLRSHVSRLTFEAIAFNQGHLYDRLSSGKPVDIAYNLELNEWNGKKELQLKIINIKMLGR